MKEAVLIIDDEEKLRGLLARIIKLEGFEVHEAGDGKLALKRLAAGDIDVVISDVKLPDVSGVELVAKIKSEFPTVEVILLTAYGNIPDSVTAIKNGAFDYLTKGDDNNRILPLLYKAIDKVRLNKRLLNLEERLDGKYSFKNILGRSKVIKDAIELTQKVAATDTTVLLTGETGTGKEVFAQAIHAACNRSKRNFIAINCSAFGKELLESEMFGHVAGAFTGAAKDKKGLFEEANGGTIFLDEIGEMGLELQAKLLRVIETGEFLRVGDTKLRKIDVRIIAATHRNLQQEVAEHHFRQDLFYRLSVFQIHLPALRERKEDIDEIASHFIKSFAVKANKRITGASPAYLQALKKHNFPGNIRELKNIIERSVILTSVNELGVDTLPFEILTAEDTGEGLNETFDLAGIEKKHIKKVLAYTKGNKTEAARLLGIGTATLYRKIEEYQL
jgi:two-component system NtrC family response regulator